MSSSHPERLVFAYQDTCSATFGISQHHSLSNDGTDAIPDSPDSLVLLVHNQFDVPQPLGYPDGSQYARVARSNHDDLEWPQVLDGGVFDGEWLALAEVLAVIVVDNRHVTHLVGVFLLRQDS